MALTKNRPTLGKAGDRPAPTKAGDRPAPTKAGETPRAAFGPAVVAAQAGWTDWDDDERVFVTVSVHQLDGSPISGLTTDKFKLFELGDQFGDCTIDLMLELGSSFPTLAGWYQLRSRLQGGWLNFVGTKPLCVQVIRMGHVSGSVMTTVGKARRS